jgi:hypothetical protein
MAIENLFKHLILAVLILVFSFWLYIYIYSQPKKACDSFYGPGEGRKEIQNLRKRRPSSIFQGRLPET